MTRIPAWSWLLALLTLTASCHSNSRNDALADARDASHRALEAALDNADRTTWAWADAETSARFGELRAYESAIEAWMLQSRDAIGAIRESPNDAVQALDPGLRALESTRVSMDARLALLDDSEVAYRMHLDAFLSAARTLIDARSGGYRREHHVLYSELVNTYQGWVEASWALRDALRAHPERLCCAAP